MIKRMTKVISIVVCFVLFTATVAIAQGGGGGGGGGGNALTLASSSVENGAVDVELNPEITLTFSNNVTNISVAEENKACFSMHDSSGNPVALDIEVPDDQLEPNRKREIVVRAKDLLPGETYMVVIAPEFSAKNGTALKKEMQISFTTAAAVPAVDEVVGAAVVEEAVVEETVAEEAETTESNTIIPVAFCLALLSVAMFCSKQFSGKSQP